MAAGTSTLNPTLITATSKHQPPEKPLPSPCKEILRCHLSLAAFTRVTREGCRCKLAWSLCASWLLWLRFWWPVRGSWTPCGRVSAARWSCRRLISTTSLSGAAAVAWLPRGERPATAPKYVLTIITCSSSPHQQRCALRLPPRLVARPGGRRGEDRAGWHMRQPGVRAEESYGEFSDPSTHVYHPTSVRGDVASLSVTQSLMHARPTRSSTLRL